MRIKLGIPLKLSYICASVGGYASYGADATVKYICSDTRELLRGDLFIALKGDNFDGEDYTRFAKETGAYCLCKSEEFGDITVNDTNVALLLLAKEYKKLLPLKHTVAITGSVGKTTTKELLEFITKKSYKTHATEKNYNNRVGVPFTILSAPQDTELLIIEAGMNHKGELSELSHCIEPTLAIITNIGTAHIGNLGSRENIAHAKYEIGDYMKGGRFLISVAEPLLNFIDSAITVGENSENADYNIEKISSCTGHDKYAFYRFGERYEFVCKRLFGAHVATCLAFALATAFEIGITDKAIQASLSSPVGALSRCQVRSLGKWRIIDDSYNASYESVISAINTLMGSEGEHHSAVLGDILELGGHSEEIHRKIGQFIASAKPARLFTFGNAASYIAIGARHAGYPAERIFENPDVSSPEITATQIIENCEKGEVILLKASHGIKISRILKILEDIHNRP